MNFLLHRELARRDLGSEIAGLGAMLPDLWRMADRRVRARPLPPDPSADGQLADLLAGIAHHLEADHAFHKSALFLDGHRRTAELFREANFTARHMVLLAHPAWELCLDGALVRARGVDVILAEIRTTLAALDRDALAAAADRHHFALVERSPPAHAHFTVRLDDLLTSIAAGDWIAGYAHGEGIAERLGGLRRRLGLKTLAADENSRLAEALELLLVAAFPAWLSEDDRSGGFESNDTLYR